MHIRYKSLSIECIGDITHVRLYIVLHRFVLFASMHSIKHTKTPLYVHTRKNSQTPAYAHTQIPSYAKTPSHTQTPSYTETLARAHTRYML